MTMNFGENRIDLYTFNDVIITIEKGIKVYILKDRAGEAR
jgi:hypothetical protein